MASYKELSTIVNGSSATGRAFQLRLYYTITKRSNNNSDVKIWINYYCYNLYLGSFPFEVNGTTYNTLAISDSSEARNEGTLWSGTTFSNLSQGSTFNITVSCDYMRSLNYSGQIYQGFSGTLSLKIPTYITTLSTPSTPTVSPSLTTRNQTVTVSWGSVSGASSYYLQYNKNNGSWINYGTVSSRSVSLYLRNLSGYSIGSVYRFRVKAMGDSSRYSDSSYSSSSSGVTAQDTPATITSLSVNKTYFSNSSSDRPTLTYNGSDVDGQTISFNILRNNSQIVSGRTALSYTDTGLGTSGGTYTYIVRIANNTSSSKSVTIYKNSVPSVSFSSPTINNSTVSYTMTLTAGSAATRYENGSRVTLSLYVGDSSTSLVKTSFSKTYTISSSGASPSGTQTFSFDYNNSSDEFVSRIGEGKYYKFEAVFYDGLDNSSAVSSSILQRPTSPQVGLSYTNIPLDKDGVEIPNYTIIGDNLYFSFDDTEANGDLRGRIRLYSSIQGYSKINFSGTVSSSSAISGIRIYRSATATSSQDSYVLIKEVTLNSGSYSDSDLNITVSGSNISGFFKDNSVPYSNQTQYWVKYRISFVDSNGIASTSSSVSQNFITNASPYFADTSLSINNDILNITPNTTAIAPVGFTMGMPLARSSYASNGSEPDEYILVNSEYLGFCDKYSFSLIFDDDIVPDSTQSSFSNQYDIKTINLHSLANVDPTLLQYDLLFIDGVSTTEYVGFGNFTAISKMRRYENVELRVYGYDTFGEQSLNYLSRRLTIDFTDSPYFDSTSFTLEDNTNRGENITILKERLLPRLINSGEQIEFSFPPAKSERAVNAGLGRNISFYQILYSVNGGDWIELKNLSVGANTSSVTFDLDEKETSDTSNYTYLHTTGDYLRNSTIDFAIRAIDRGYEDSYIRSSNLLLSDFKDTEERQRYSDIMMCRVKNPIIQIEDIAFEGSTPEVETPFSINFSILDIGGSYLTSPNDYFKQENYTDQEQILQRFGYKNFERNLDLNKTGQFMIIQLLYSETYSFENEPIELINRPGSLFEDNVLSFPVTYISNGILDANKNWYIKIRILVGKDTNSVSTNLDTCLIGESSVVVLRSLKPTMGIRDRKIGINVLDPAQTLRVSAGGSSENDSTILFDDGINYENNSSNLIVRFNLLNGHMTRGIVDCGRLR